MSVCDIKMNYHPLTNFFSKMSFNESLINGDMKTVRELISQGKTWFGPKNDFDRNKIIHPSDAGDFAEHLKLILDLELQDCNYRGHDDIHFTWYLSPSHEEALRISQVTLETYEDITFKCIIDGYLQALIFYEEAEKKEGKGLLDYSQPQILISKSGVSYQITIEAYPDCTCHDVLSLSVDNNTLLKVLSRLSTVNVYTC
jgi:hypothetical protein